MNLETLGRLAAEELARRPQTPEPAHYELELHRVELELQNEELRRTERKLQELVGQYETLYEHAPVALMTLDATGIVQGHNVRARQLFGTELTGRPLSALIDRRAADDLHRALVDVSWTTLEREFDRPDASPIVGRFRRLGNDGAVLAAITAADIVEEKTHFEAIMHATHDGVLVIRNDRTIERANEGAERMFGWSTGELEGRTLDDLVGTELGEQIWARVFDALQAGTSRVHASWSALSGKHADGQVFPFQLSLTVVRGEDGSPNLVATMVDQTPQQHLDKHMRTGTRIDTISHLCGNVAHDIKNLLMGVNGCVELARNNSEPHSASLMYLEEAETALQAGKEIANQLLAFARPEPSITQSFVVDDAIRSRQILLRGVVGSMMTLKLELDAQAVTVLLPETVFEELLVSLVMNARQIASGGRHLTISTRVVSDATKRARGTNGSTRQVVQLLVGNDEHAIDVLLPAHMPEGTFTGHGADGPGRIVLVLTDYAPTLEALSTVLGDDGWEVLAARNADTARDLIRDRDDVGAILVDVLLDGVPSMRTVEELRALQPAARVVFTSGVDRDVLVKDGRLDPDAVFVAKPYDLGELRRLLES